MRTIRPAAAPTAAVDDDGLAGGNPASTANDLNANVGDAAGDTSEATFTGTLGGSFGADGAGSFSFANLNNATTQYRHREREVHLGGRHADSDSV